MSKFNVKTDGVSQRHNFSRGRYFRFIGVDSVFSEIPAVLIILVDNKRELE